jgi:hypothetical protein
LIHHGCVAPTRYRWTLDSAPASLPVYAFGAYRAGEGRASAPFEPPDNDCVMPAKKADDPLDLVALRLPRSELASARVEAETTGRTLSDVLRTRISSSAVKPLGKPRPQRRSALPVEGVSRCDPELTRKIAAIGSNLNQLARAANTAAVTGTSVQVITLLAQLCTIERELGGLVLKREEKER